MKEKNINQNRTLKNIKKAFPYYIMLLPGFIYLIINNYIPMAGVVIAFKNVDFRKGIFRSDWIGFKNFEYLFKTPDALLITRNTILYNLAFIVVNMAVAIRVCHFPGRNSFKNGGKTVPDHYFAAFYHLYCDCQLSGICFFGR